MDRRQQKTRKRLDCGLGTLKERNRMDIARFRLQNLMLKNNEARVHRSFKIGCMRAFCFMFVLEELVRNGRTLLRLKNEHI